MELYGAGLERMTEIVFEKGEAGREILEQLGRDELVGNLLAANGLHPLDLETRVRRAVEKLHTRLRSKATVELLGIERGRDPAAPAGQRLGLRVVRRLAQVRSGGGHLRGGSGSGPARDRGAGRDRRRLRLCAIGEARGQWHEPQMAR